MNGGTFFVRTRRGFEGALRSGRDTSRYVCGAAGALAIWSTELSSDAGDRDRNFVGFTPIGWVAVMSRTRHSHNQAQDQLLESHC